MRVSSFVGPSNELATPLVDPDETINFYLESTPPGSGKAPQYLIGTAGLTPFATINDSPGRGMFEQDGHLFAVAGSTFTEVDEAGTVVEYGTVDVGDFQVSFASNGTAGEQLALTSGDEGYIFDLVAHTFTQITDAGFPPFPGQIEFLDGYFLVCNRNSRRFNISALEDGLVWDSLDVAERSIASDNIVSFIRRDREIWLIGSKTSEVWYDNGDPLFPFAPTSNSFLEMGSAGAFTALRLGGSIVWMGKNIDGTGTIIIANGYTPDRISTYAMERFIQLGPDLRTPLLGVGWQQLGHTHYVVQIPNAIQCPVFDLTENRWHKRAVWNPTLCVWERDIIVSHAFAFNKHLVQSKLNGVIYELSTTAYDYSLLS